MAEKVGYIQGFVRKLVRSLGLKRKLSAAFQTIALIISFVPILAPFTNFFITLAGWFGIAGITHASVKEELADAKFDAKIADGKEISEVTMAEVKGNKLGFLPTAAAFFNALVIATDTVPQLAAYKALFLFLASVLSALSSATSLAIFASK